MKLYDLYIIYKDGRDIYHKDFSSSDLDPSIISGFLQALADFAKEALPSKGALKEIEKGDIKIIFNHGQFISMALICEAKDEGDMIFLKNRLTDLISRIEKRFHDVLVDWKGGLDDFKGLDDIVEESFRELMRLSKPPTLEELINKRDFYFYSIDEDGLNIYEVFYKNSWSFKNFLKAINVQLSVVNQILNRLKSTFLSLNEIQEEFNLESEVLVKLLRNLALRGIVSVCS
ncbi:MAG: hypothetical protein ACTSYR_00270 [Candidatus Odinarchaeia archaeon]